MKLKKFFSVIVIILLIFQLCGCSNQNNESPSSENESSAGTSETIYVDPQSEDEDKEQAETEKRELIRKNNLTSVINDLTMQVCKIENGNDADLYNTIQYLNNAIKLDSFDSNTKSFLSDINKSLADLEVNDSIKKEIEYLNNQQRATILEKLPVGDIVVDVVDVVDSVVHRQYLDAFKSAVDAGINLFTNSDDSDEQIDGTDIDRTQIVKDIKQRLFDYRAGIIDSGDVQESDLLTPDDANYLIGLENEENPQVVLNSLKNTNSNYQCYAGHLIMLINNYYNNKEYSECYNKTEEYIKLRSNTDYLRYDYEFAQILPISIYAIEEILEGKELEDKMNEYNELLLNNSNNDWYLKFFGALNYGDLWDITDNEEYLSKAYDLFKSNTATLIPEQIWLNTDYIEKGEKELPIIDEALLMNVNCLYWVGEELEIDQKSRNEINAMLHNNATDLFLVKTIDDYYWYDKDWMIPMDIEFDGKKLTLPAGIMSEKTIVELKVGNTVVNDWYIKNIKGKKNSDYSEYRYELLSDTVKNIKFNDGDVIKLTVYVYDDYIEPIEYLLSVEKKFLSTKFNVIE